MYGRGYYVNEEGDYIRHFNVLPFDRELLKTTDYILQPAAFWRRSLWGRVGELDTKLNYAFDWEWFARASRVTDFDLVDADLARYRLTGENKSLTSDPRRERELAKVARRNGGFRQPTFLYWNARRLGRRWRRRPIRRRPLGQASAADLHMSEVLVSAIVSTYDASRFIDGCLADLEAQTIAEHLEIIVVDSGSPGDEGRIVAEFQRRFDNIVYLRTERESLYDAWNRGIHAARGLYITNANTDDRHRADALERLARSLDERPDAALATQIAR